MDYKAGDTVVTDEGTFLIISADGFNLKDEDSQAKYILVNAEYGSMEGYAYDLNEIWKYYCIREIIPNHKSSERRNEK